MNNTVPDKHSQYIHLTQQDALSTDIQFLKQRSSLLLLGYTGHQPLEGRVTKVQSQQQIHDRVAHEPVPADGDGMRRGSHTIPAIYMCSRRNISTNAHLSWQDIAKSRLSYHKRYSPVSEDDDGNPAECQCQRCQQRIGCFAAKHAQIHRQIQHPHRACHWFKQRSEPEASS